MQSERYRTEFGSGRDMASAEATHAAAHRQSVDDKQRQMYAMGEGWQDGSWDSADQQARADFVKEREYADIRDGVGQSIHRSVDIGEDHLHQAMRQFGTR